MTFALAPSSGETFSRTTGKGLLVGGLNITALWELRSETGSSSSSSILSVIPKNSTVCVWDQLAVYTDEYCLRITDMNPRTETVAQKPQRNEHSSFHSHLIVLLSCSQGEAYLHCTHTSLIHTHNPMPLPVENKFFMLRVPFLLQQTLNANRNCLFLRELKYLENELRFVIVTCITLVTTTVT